MSVFKLLFRFFLLLIVSIIFIKHVNASQPNFAYRERDYIEKPIQICMDSNFWFPYTFTFKNKPYGLHADIVNEAIKQLDYKAKFVAKPWEKCLSDIKDGLMDGVVSVSYSSLRHSYISYPEDAAKEAVSNWRLTQVAYYPVTSRQNNNGGKNNYNYNGELSTLPAPIRIESGYSVGNELKKLDLDVLDEKNSITSLKNLIYSKQGTVITVNETAQMLRKKPMFRGKLVVHNIPIKSKSYFFGFSRNTDISRRIQRKIWNKIKEIREDKQLTSKFLSRYGFD